MSHPVSHSLSSEWSSDSAVKRIDLHCHTDASNEADEIALNAIQCPESFSSPDEVYEQAKRRKMDFVTVTDHDSIAGVARLLDRPDVLPGEELTCYFPEDRCKIHLLVWGLNSIDHDALQRVAGDIYKVAEVIEVRRLAHSVAHPLYRQNDRLEKWHLERLILMFKGFETLNGAHSLLHRQAFEPLLDELTPHRIHQYSAIHRMTARWPQPHIKSRTGGSDDHGLFNIGRTWTEFPATVRGPQDILECLRTGHCRPGGEAGSSLKLAHNFFSVGVRYYGRRMRRGKKSQTCLTQVVLESLIGERPPMRKRDFVKLAIKHKAREFGRRLLRPLRRAPEPTGAALLRSLFVDSCKNRLGDHPALKNAIAAGHPALAEHAAMFDFTSDINRDIAAGVASAVQSSIARGELNGIFDSLSTVAAHQFLMMPYYFALFHQNRERNLLNRITGNNRRPTTNTMKLGVFTDTFDEINGVARFIQDMSSQAVLRNRSLIVHTCNDNPRIESPARKNFRPLLSRTMPAYPDQPLTLPPVAEILEWADRQQFDAIHVHTPGPMGLCGYLVAKMLRIPLVGTYHTDFPRYVNDIIGDHRLTVGCTAYMKWFYGQTEMIFSRSKDYVAVLNRLGFGNEKIASAPPALDSEKFCPQKRDLALWSRLSVSRPHKLLYAGRVSVEKNLPLLAEAFRELCGRRNDVALVIAGDGPYAAKLKKELDGLPVHFLGYQNDAQLAALYASSDLFVFPSKTDTLGQVVIEAQSSGLPVLVSNTGGPREVMDDQITGVIVNADTPAAWCDEIDHLLNDTPRRLRMSRTAPHRVARFSQGNAFETFWDKHLTLVNPPADREEVKSPQVQTVEA